MHRDPIGTKELLQLISSLYKDIIREKDWAFNYKNKVEEIKRIMKHWEKRNLTPFGRLTVIKTLLIPKLNHLICTIPNPSQSMINSLEKDFYNFLWKSKRHKIKKNVAIQDYEDGGLKMIN